MGRKLIFDQLKLSFDSLNLLLELFSPVFGYNYIIHSCFSYASNTNLTGLCRASGLKVADFSYNFFTGSIPKCLGYLPRYTLSLSPTGIWMSHKLTLCTTYAMQHELPRELPSEQRSKTAFFFSLWYVWHGYLSAFRLPLLYLWTVVLLSTCLWTIMSWNEEQSPWIRKVWACGCLFQGELLMIDTLPC